MLSGLGRPEVKNKRFEALKSEVDLKRLGVAKCPR
jgi:hypothetical protein